MKNAYAISSLSRQIVKVCEQIESLAMGVQDSEQGIGDVADTYQAMLVDELEHVQTLTLKMTEMVSQAVSDEAENADEGEGSVFSEGDLTAEKTGAEDGGGEPAPEQKPSA